MSNLYPKRKLKETEDLTGKQFGEWTVIRRATIEELEKQGYSHTYSRLVVWICICSCGKEHSVPGVRLKNGLSNRCKTCANSKQFDSQYEDLTGKRFGKLTVIKRIRDSSTYRKRQWLCRCDCGIEVMRRPSDFHTA